MFAARVVRIFYRQNKDINSFLRSNGSVSRTDYLRILALASIDILITLPFGVVSLALAISANVAQDTLPLYFGWSVLHDDWDPIGVPYEELQANGAASLADFYFIYWSSPVLAFVIFALFGVTAEARASYWRAIRTIGGWLGLMPASRAGPMTSHMGTMEFSAPPQGMISLDVETG